MVPGGLPYACTKYGYPPEVAPIASKRPCRPRGTRVRRAPATPGDAVESRRSILTYRNRRSEYDFEADKTLGRCGSPAPT